MAVDPVVDTVVDAVADTVADTVRVRLDVSYDGTDFSGWAAQPGQRTVAGVLADALARLAGADGATGLVCAGRTDAGVHATGQVCHVDLTVRAWRSLGESLPRRLGAVLPPDVRVRSAVEMPPDFDARFSALFRRYEYRVTDASWGAEPLRRRDTVAWPRPLDVDRLNAAAAGLLGEHDFAAFCRRKENAGTVRAITSLTWRRGGDDGADGTLVATVQADAFCQSMVRSLVGAMLVVGDGRREPDWPASLLSRRERAGEVTVAPAHGLTLVRVGYPSDRYGERAEATRRRRQLRPT
jgi:tRNA pseudouridine38-40 synthase